MLRAQRRHIHRPDPGADNQCLQRQADPQLPAQQFTPAPLPGDQRSEREHRHDPYGRALGEKAQGERDVQDTIPEHPGAPPFRVEPRIGTGQRERNGGEQRRIGRKPDGHLV